MSQGDSRRANTKRLPLAQLVFCQGCCCGRTDRGRPELPVDVLKTVWKEEKLNRSIQLTISGCLGPCDLANVTLLMTPHGNTWLANIEGNDSYNALINWAIACRDSGTLVPLPEQFGAHCFDRFQSSVESPV